MKKVLFILLLILLSGCTKYDNACKECGYNQSTDSNIRMRGFTQVECDEEHIITIYGNHPVEYDKWGLPNKYEVTVGCHNIFN